MSGNSPGSIRPATPESIAQAGRLLRDGGLVAVPTETVYGLAARADSDEAVARIYRAKGRPSFNPLIVHVSDLTEAGALAVVDERAQRLAKRFWPGPMTLVLPLLSDARLAHAVTAGLPTVALRCPAHPVMQAVLRAAGVPLAAPSANRSGLVSPSNAEHVSASLGERVDMILDAGACECGLESTIVALRQHGWDMLRPGPITLDDLEAVLGPPLGHTAERIEAPGQLASHYAPGKPMRLDAQEALADEFHIGFGSVAGDFSLSAAGNLAEAGARLYEALHRAAAAAYPGIAVAPIPDEGIGIAINDRLRRAAL